MISTAAADRPSPHKQTIYNAHDDDNDEHEERENLIFTIILIVKNEGKQLERP